MQTEDSLRLLVEDIHSAVPATLDGEGRPQTRVIAPKHCLHCGRCAEICPIGAIESRF